MLLLDCFSIGDENELTTGNSVSRKNRGRNETK